MPGAVIHLLMAKKILDSLMVVDIPRQSLFYAGSIAPDSAHAKKNYTRAHKTESHFRSGIKGIEIYEDKNIKLMYERIDDFMKVNSNKKDQFLYLGYIVHILTDLHFQLIIKKDYIREMSKSRTFIDHIDFYQEMIDDERVVCKNLLVTHPSMIDIKNLLLSCTDYNIEPLFTGDELQRAKEWVVQRKLNVTPSVTETRYVTYDHIMNFINEISDRILDDIRPYLKS